MKNTVLSLALASAAALFGCADSSDGAGPIVPPPIEDIFIDGNQDGVVGDPYVVYDSSGRPVEETPGGELLYETLYLFDDVRMRELCLWPDADSFDDYEEIAADGTVIIPRGTTPVSTNCPADGIVTGPMHEELLPSSWCRIEDCEVQD